MLPLSLWHVVMGWVDLITDVCGIVSTKFLSETIPPVCGVNVQYYFRVCFFLQLAFLIGNQLSHSIVAGVRARSSDEESWILACARGLLNLELAYHVFKKASYASTATRSASSNSHSSSSYHTRAALTHKMVELVWEAPQVMVAVVVLLARVTIQEAMDQAGLQAEDLSTLLKWLQLANAAGGLASLSLGALDFMRVHPHSFWATASPPSRLLLGLVDVSKGSWFRSLAMGIYAFASLLGRACLVLLLVFAAANSRLLDTHPKMKTPRNLDTNPSVLTHVVSHRKKVWGMQRINHQ